MPHGFIVISFILVVLEIIDPNCTLIYDLLLKVWLMGCTTFFVMTDGEMDGRWWPALSGHCLSWTGCCQYLLNMKCLTCGLLFLQLSTSLWCFRPRTSFLKNGSHWYTWTSFISYLHTILRIISRSASGLAIDSPWGVWDCGWTTCLLCGGPISGLFF